MRQDGYRPQGLSLCGLKFLRQLCLLQNPELPWFLQGRLVFSESKHWLQESWLNAGKFSLRLEMAPSCNLHQDGGLLMSAKRPCRYGQSYAQASCKKLWFWQVLILSAQNQKHLSSNRLNFVIKLSKHKEKTAKYRSKNHIFLWLQ